MLSSQHLHQMVHNHLLLMPSSDLLGICLYTRVRTQTHTCTHTTNKNKINLLKNEEGCLGESLKRWEVWKERGVLGRCQEQEHATQRGMNAWCRGMHGSTSPHIGMARKQRFGIEYRRRKDLEMNWHKGLLGHGKDFFTFTVSENLGSIEWFGLEKCHEPI